MRQARRGVVVLASVLAGCGLRVGAPARPGAPTVVGAPCNSVADCPKPAEPCMVAACTGGGCRVEVAAAEVVPEAQTPGDCKQLICDGRGETFSREDHDDVPPDDGNDCTEKRCAGDTPQTTPRAAGAACKAGVCNGAGLCGVCLPGVHRCEHNAPESCSEEGQWSHAAACSGAAPVCNERGCTGVAALALGNRETCARFADGSARCWGSNLAGNLAGQSRHSRVNLPPGGLGDLTLGARHGCVVRGGAVQCWGANDEGQLGDGTRVEGSAMVLGVKGAKRVAAGDTHTCALLGDGTVWCWGGSHAGAAGPKGRPAPPAMGPVTSLTTANYTGPFAQIVMGGDRTCGRMQDGSVDCWGEGAARGAFATLAQAPSPARGKKPAPPPKGPPPPAAPKPSQVRGIKGAVEIAAGGDRTCVRLGDGSVSCWTGATGAPEAVHDLDGAHAIAVGRAHACALLGDGSVWCWGDGSKGQLAYNRNMVRKGVGKVPGLLNATSIAARGDHTCARLGDGGVVCWGDNASGELGDGTTTARTGPVVVRW